MNGTRKSTAKFIEQSHCVAFVSYLEQYHPDIAALTFHIPNESKTSQRTDIGIKKGVPDYFVSIPSGIYHGLYIEFKRPAVINHKNGGLSEDQMKMIPLFRKEGYIVEVVYDYKDAISVVLEYYNNRLDPTKLQKIEEWYDTDGSVGGLNQIMRPD